MITSIPYVVAVLLLKLLLHKLGHPGILEFSDLGIVYTGGVFLLGFNLAGTMADYKESERIPGELACIFETMEDSLKQAAKLKPDLDLYQCRKLHAATLSAIVEWLLRKESQPALFGDVASTIEVAYALDKAGTPAIAGRYVSELHNIRKCITRMGVISRTGALESGFAFLQFLTAAIIVLLLMSKFKHPLSETILVSFVSLIYIYMLRLITDIDDPFEYSPDGRRRGCAEVELFPILEYQQRLKERLIPPAPESPSLSPSPSVSPPSPGPASPAGPAGPAGPVKVDGLGDNHAGSGKEGTSDPHSDHGGMASHANTANTTNAATPPTSAAASSANAPGGNPSSISGGSSSGDGISHVRSHEAAH